MYLTSTISVALVLFLVGILSSMVLASRTLIKGVRESVTVYVEIKDSVPDNKLKDFGQMLQASRYCHDHKFISAEEALQEHIAQMGEDPTELLGYNPLRAAFEIHTTEQYAQKDSVENIKKQLMSLPYVERVSYQTALLEGINSKVIRNIVWVLLITMGLLTIISFTLIINTIRLQIYSQRFLINTMTLVGATAWTIRAPFIRRNILMGFIASLLALFILSGALYYVFQKLNIPLFAITLQNGLILAGIIVLSGILITTLAAIFSTGRYLRMNRDTMYRI